LREIHPRKKRTLKPVPNIGAVTGILLKDIIITYHNHQNDSIEANRSIQILMIDRSFFQSVNKDQIEQKIYAKLRKLSGKISYWFSIRDT
jgi:hypothetical protein